MPSDCPLRQVSPDVVAEHARIRALDNAGGDRTVIEQGYRSLLAVEPGVAAWWGDAACFLLTLARVPQAIALIDEGLAVLEPGEAVWNGLLRPAVRLLLHRSRLAEARRLLDLPVARAHGGKAHKALSDRLIHLQAAADGTALFPLSIPPDRWWQGPHLLKPTDDGDDAVQNWAPARFDFLNARGVNLMVARKDEAQPEPTYSRLVLEVNEFDAICKDGTGLAPWLAMDGGGFLPYLELGWNNTGRHPCVIRVHRNISWEDPDLPPLPADPARFLRASGRVL